MNTSSPALASLEAKFAIWWAKLCTDRGVISLHPFTEDERRIADVAFIAGALAMLDILKEEENAANS